MLTYLMWNEADTVEVHSVEELIHLLDHLSIQAQQDMPFSVELYIGNKASMFIVVGSDISPAGFSSNTSRPPIVSSRNQNGNQSGYFEFNHRGHYSAVHCEYTISISEARKAFLYFFETGQRPVNILWE